MKLTSRYRGMLMNKMDEFGEKKILKWYTKHHCNPKHYCALRILGLFFLDNDGDKARNGERYRRMITDYFWDEIGDNDVEELRILQDDAPWTR